MSDFIKHECGIALVRLLKPYQYYIDKYGSPLYGLDRLFLLMEKQRNRGQDGAGVAVIKSDVNPGTRYISRYRSADKSALNGYLRRFIRNSEMPIKSIQRNMMMPYGLKKM